MLLRKLSCAAFLNVLSIANWVEYRLDKFCSVKVCKESGLPLITSISPPIRFSKAALKPNQTVVLSPGYQKNFGFNVIFLTFGMSEKPSLLGSNDSCRLPE